MIETVHTGKDFVIFYFKNNYYKCSLKTYYKLILKEIKCIG